jgi:hypothetical protein
MKKALPKRSSSAVIFRRSRSETQMDQIYYSYNYGFTAITGYNYKYD